MLQEHGIDAGDNALMCGDLAGDLLAAVMEASKRARPQSDEALIHQAYMAVIANVTHTDPKTKGGQLARAAKLVRDSDEDYSPELIMRQYSETGWWFRVYRAWMKQRGQRIPPPTIQQVLDTLKQALEWETRADQGDDYNAIMKKYTGGQYADIIEH